MINEEYFKVFSHYTLHDSWDKLIEYATIRSDIDDDFRGRIIETYNILRKILKEEFLKHAKSHHPLIHLLSNKGKEDYEELICFVECLRAFEQLPNSNYEALVRKILQSETSKSEGKPFLDIGTSLLRAGFEVRFESEIANKVPDIQFTNAETGEVFFAEVTMLEDSDERKRNSSVYYAINYFLFNTQPIIPYSGKLLKRFNPSRLDFVLKLIQEKKNLAKRTNSFVILNADESDGLVEIAFAPEVEEQELINWSSEKGYKPYYFESLPVNFNETPRIRGNKLKRKAKQLPANHLGLIYIPVNPLYFFAKNPLEIMGEIQTKLQEFPHVLGVIIYSYLGRQIDNQAIANDMHVYMKTMIREGLQQDLLFIYNHGAKVKISPQSLGMVYKSLSSFVNVNASFN